MDMALFEETQASEISKPRHTDRRHAKLLSDHIIMPHIFIKSAVHREHLFYYDPMICLKHNQAADFIIRKNMTSSQLLKLTGMERAMLMLQ